jgi:Flp pilus assembly protein TadG
MRFWKDETGATLIYVSLIILVLTGATGLALDSGRLFTLRHEVQKAADAAALAGAWQLDGTLGGSQKADVAARTTPVVVNNQKFGSSSGAVSIASTTFWRGIPASDDTALTLAAPPYDFIEVTTTAVTHNTLLMRALGAASTSTVTAKAVARKGAAICQVTPLFMCLPGGASFDPTAWIGHQVLMKAPQGGSWTNGNWGLLDTPGGSQSAGALASMLAGVNGLPQCIGVTGVDTKPGNVASISPAFNVRLDVYENLPGNVNYQTTPGYPPAEHVQKGTAPNASCTARPTPVGGAIPTGFPRDSDMLANNSATRFGNGQWDCATYWTQAHPGNSVNMPAACSATGGLSRYEMYLHEITSLSAKALIPDLTGSGGDNGDPSERTPSVCYSGGSIPPTPTAAAQRINDRRIFTVAGVDCSALAINGNTPNVPVHMYLSMFLTEPAITQGADNGTVRMEIVGHDVAGGGGLVPIQLREWVELVR